VTYPEIRWPRASGSAQRVSEDGHAAERQYTGLNSTASVGGLTPTNKPFRVNGVSVGVLNTDGKIASHRPQSAQVMDPQIYCAVRFLPVFQPLSGQAVGPRGG
jgi:hypothetical protein